MKGVIFDLDGVLCSTDEYHYRAWKALADSLGIPFDRTINSRLRGVSREESLEIILERAGRHYSAEEKREMFREKNELYRTFLSALSVEDLAPGAAKMLHELRRAGKNLAVGSSSRNAQFILEKLGSRGCSMPWRTGTGSVVPNRIPKFFCLPRSFCT